VPITYRVDRDARLIRAEVHGDFTVTDIVDTVNAAAGEAGPGFDVLSDHRGVGEPATRTQLEQMVGLEALRRNFVGRRWAVVVSSRASFGMMRMLEVLAERVPMTVRVFVSIERAERWARGSTDPDLAAGDPPPPV
jgi:hypothetical protein